MQLSVKLNKALQDTKSIYWLAFLLSLLLYGNTFFNAYNLDDELVTLNHRLTSKGISAIPEIVTSPYYQDEAGYAYEYRPLVLISFAIEHQFFGDNATISHLVNFLLYFLSLLFLFKFLKLLFGDSNTLLSFLSVLLFATFPLHTEVISSIKNRDIILAVLFSLVGGYYFLNFYLSKNFLYLFLASLSYLFALVSKSDSVVFLVIIPVAILLFYDFDISKFSSIIISLFVCSFYFIPVYSLINKLIFYTLVLLFLGILLLLVDWKKFWTLVNNLLKSTQVSKTHSSDFKSIWPSKFSFEYLFIYLLLFLLSGATYYLDIYPKYVYVFVFFISQLVFWFSEKREWNVFFVLLNYLLLNLFIPFDNKLFDVIMFSSVFFTFGLNRFSFLGTILFLVSFVFLKVKTNEPFFDNNYFFFNFIILAFYFLVRTKFFVPILLLYLGLVIYSFFANLYSAELSFFLLTYSALAFIFPFVFVTAYYFLEEKKAIILVSFTLFAIFSMAALYHDFGDFSYKNKAAETRKNLKVAEFTPIKNVNRPINFVEFPVDSSASLNIKLGTSSHVVGLYMKKILLPYPMGFYYGYSFIIPVGLNSLSALLSLLLCFLLGILFLFYFKKAKILAFGIFLLLIGLLAFSNLVQPLPGVIADRFTYIASIGFCIIVAFGMLHFFKISSDKQGNFSFSNSFFIATGCLLLLYSSLTIARNFQWKNHLTLMRHDIDYLDKSAQAHNLLALNLMKYSFEKEYQNKSQAMREEALLHFKKAVEIYPDFFNAWYDLGRVYMLFNDLDKAYPCFEKVRSMDSSFVLSTVNMALIADAKGNTKLAENLYKEVLRINPGTQEAYGGLGYVYFKSGQLIESIKINEEAIKLFPQWTEPYQNIINIYLSQKDTASAQRVMNQMPR